jgi:protein-L-isoaspartate(D-aspartate) O-methyltransferase
VLRGLGVENVALVVGDGSGGWPEAAPYDAVNVAAAAEDDVPEALVEQLGPGGRLVAPVERGDQHLVLVRRTDGDVERTRLERVRFVPLTSSLSRPARGGRSA